MADPPATARRNRRKSGGQDANDRQVFSAEIDQRPAEFRGFEGSRPLPRLHCHDDIEVAVHTRRIQWSFVGYGWVVLPPRRLYVFWGARPHGPLEIPPDERAYVIDVPLPWLLRWRLPETVVHPLLAGQVLLAPTGRRLVADFALVKNWVYLMRQDSAETRRIVLLEVEARLRRLALELASAGAGEQPIAAARPQPTGAIGRFERMLTLMASHFREPLSVEDIAEAVRMRPPSAMRLFRSLSGMTVHEYLVQHRVIHAQWLLATTDAKLGSIAAESGFGSLARFHASFQKMVGRSPADYRRSLRGAGQ